MWVIWLALIVTGGWYLLLLLTALFDKWAARKPPENGWAEAAHLASVAALDAQIKAHNRRVLTGAPCNPMCLCHSLGRPNTAPKAKGEKP